jgi:hypothetical protein
MDMTPSMHCFIAHFGALGARWGIEADTCRAQALLCFISPDAIAPPQGGGEFHPSHSEGGRRRAPIMPIMMSGSARRRGCFERPKN